MKSHHTKDKGDIGVLKAQADLAEKGWLVLKPQTEHSPFDIVIYKNNVFKRVQVKYRSINKLGQLAIAFKSYWSNKVGTHKSSSDISEMDIICIYCPELDKCCYIDRSEITKGLHLVLRVECSRNFQKKKVKMFSDYYKVPE